MDSTLYDAEYVLKTIINSLDGDGPFDALDWPKEVKDNVALFTVFRDLLEIIRGILLENDEFKNSYYGRDTKNAAANAALASLCQVIDTLAGTVSKNTLDAYCTALSTCYKQFNALDSGYLVANDLTDLTGILFTLVGNCQNYRHTCRSLEALHLAAQLASVNASLKKLKEKLESIATASQNVATAIAFLGKAVAVLAKILPLL